MTPARILLVDDHLLFREGLASLIESQADMTVVGQAQNGLEAVGSVRELEPDLVIMDVNMPVSNGLEATQKIRASAPDMRIIMLTVRDEDDVLFEAIKAGANGYMLKLIDAERCLADIRAALAGDVVLPPAMAGRFLREFARLSQAESYAGLAPVADTGADEPQDHGLTARELEVLGLLADGLTDKEIAAQLSISVNTVKSHVRNILSKLQAASRWEAAQRGRDAGLLDD